MPKALPKPVRWNGYTIEFSHDQALDESGVSGDVNFGDGIIRLHSKERGKTALDSALHEGVHALDPDMSEAKVLYFGRALSELVHKLGYRRVPDHPARPKETP